MLRQVGFFGNGTGTGPLLHIEGSEAISLERCQFVGGPEIGLSIVDAAVTVSDCDFSGQGDAAIHAVDSRGLLLQGNRIRDCGNAGIRIWRSANGLRFAMAASRSTGTAGRWGNCSSPVRPSSGCSSG